jgi:hypothetical protein
MSGPGESARESRYRDFVLGHRTSAAWLHAPTRARKAENAGGRRAAEGKSGNPPRQEASPSVSARLGGCRSGAGIIASSSSPPAEFPAPQGAVVSRQPLTRNMMSLADRLPYSFKIQDPLPQRRKNAPFQ